MSTKKATMRQKKSKKQQTGTFQRPDKPSRHAVKPAQRSAKAAALPAPNGSYFIWGSHAINAALANHNRHIAALYVTADQADYLKGALHSLPSARQATLPEPQIIEKQRFDRLTSDGTKIVHQGLAAAIMPLDDLHLEEFLFELPSDMPSRVMILDQVSDPRNIGAIMRSARAFGISALILQDRHAPLESGALARTAAGALEDVPIIRVVNLARAIEELKDANFHIAGLDMAGSFDASHAGAQDRLALVMGSEGKGMRRLVKEACDEVLAIQMADNSESLNVSVAAAIIMHHTQKK